MDKQALIEALNALPYTELTEVFTAARQARGLKPHDEPYGYNWRVGTIVERAADNVDARMRIIGALMDVDKCERAFACHAAFHSWLTPDDLRSHVQCQQRVQDLNNALARREHEPMFCVRGG